MKLSFKSALLLLLIFSLAAFFIFIFIENKKLSTKLYKIENTFLSDSKISDDQPEYDENEIDVAYLLNQQNESLNCGMTAAYTYYELMNFNHYLDEEGNNIKDLNYNIKEIIYRSDYNNKISKYYNDINPKIHNKLFYQKKQIFKILKEVFINRNGDYLHNNFTQNKNSYYRYFSSKAYKNLNCDNLVDGLLISYSKIIAKPNYTESLDTIYTELTTQEEDRPARSIFIDNLGLVDNMPDIAFNEFLGVEQDWLIDFWVRRNKEGNMHQVRDILFEIDSYYAN